MHEGECEKSADSRGSQNECYISRNRWRMTQQYSRRVRVGSIHENLTESTRIPPTSGLECIQVCLESSDRVIRLLLLLLHIRNLHGLPFDF